MNNIKTKEDFKDVYIKAIVEMEAVQSRLQKYVLKAEGYEIYNNTSILSFVDKNYECQIICTENIYDYEIKWGYNQLTTYKPFEGEARELINEIRNKYNYKSFENDVTYIDEVYGEEYAKIVCYLAEGNYFYIQDLEEHGSSLMYLAVKDGPKELFEPLTSQEFIKVLKEVISKYKLDNELALYTLSDYCKAQISHNDNVYQIALKDDIVIVKFNDEIISNISTNIVEQEIIKPILKSSKELKYQGLYTKANTLMQAVLYKANKYLIKDTTPVLDLYFNQLISFGDNDFEFQLIGCEQINDNIWSWATDYSIYNEDLLDLAQSFKDNTEVDFFNEDDINITNELNPKVFTNMMCYLANEDYFIYPIKNFAQTGDTMYLAVSGAPEEIFNSLEADEFIDVINEVIRNYNVNHRLALEELVKYCQGKIRSNEEENIEIKINDEIINVELNEGTIKKIN